MDYAGPILIKDRSTRSAKLVKSYICFTTKPIHVEVTDCTTDSFLSAFKRFVAGRGKPVHLFSDDASNFVGAHNQLKELYLLLENNKSELLNKFTDERIQWHFNPPHSPNFGGVWEAGVKSIKHHLK